MLDNLRSMAVFASVVEKGSFSGAARELGITTSAVSQQIRQLEHEMGTALLHRSTRKLSLTEAGGIFYQSCQEMVAAAKLGVVRVSELRDELVGDLRIATSPELGAYHVLPALSGWIRANPRLNVHFQADNRYIDLIEERIDIAIRMSPGLADSNLIARPMTQTRIVLCASPDYLMRHDSILRPADLEHHERIQLTFTPQHETRLRHRLTGEETTVKVNSRLHTNNVFMLTSLMESGLGIGGLLSVDLPPAYNEGRLVEVLPEWEIQPHFTIYAITLRREQPLKVVRCIETLGQYFSQRPCI